MTPGACRERRGLDGSAGQGRSGGGENRAMLERDAGKKDEGRGVPRPFSCPINPKKREFV